MFGSPFDERRYKKVLRECALTTDMKQWKDGDETVVGQRGTALRCVSTSELVSIFRFDTQLFAAADRRYSLFASMPTTIH